MRRTIGLAVTAVLLLLVTFHATMPVSAPLERASGSAFSAATVDVSLGAEHHQQTEQRVIGIAPVPSPAPILSISRRDDAIESIALAWPTVRGPPARPIATSPLAPRAPPAA